MRLGSGDSEGELELAAHRAVTGHEPAVGASWTEASEAGTAAEAAMAATAAGHAGGAGCFSGVSVWLEQHDLRCSAIVYRIWLRF